MDPETFIIAVFCLVDETLAALLDGRRLRQRGPAPVLADGAVLTIDTVGACLGLDQDEALFDHVRRDHADLFPALRRVHRPAFGHLVERYRAKRGRARDRWHLCGRLLRKVLSHTLAASLNAALGNPPLQLARLLD